MHDALCLLISLPLSRVPTLGDLRMGREQRLQPVSYVWGAVKMASWMECHELQYLVQPWKLDLERDREQHVDLVREATCALPALSAKCHRTSVMCGASCAPLLLDC
jgi:hypothetical protein